MDTTNLVDSSDYEVQVRRFVDRRDDAQVTPAEVIQVEEVQADPAERDLVDLVEDLPADPAKQVQADQNKTLVGEIWFAGVSIQTSTLVNSPVAIVVVCVACSNFSTFILQTSPWY
ncbi:hypothetical protein F511_27168 [Dorcoceras hygrometricum]|uniref:Uncharacterized protein n=1 Tax=Dorcoceras hygrometricum TaxID=472368 RepID=A0A2Z7CER2_9LAMI|nr:hypothetical protein F511_27168 [Dorcoceras hygrometricum]